MATGTQTDLLNRIRLLEKSTGGLSGGDTGTTTPTSTAIEQLATLSATADTIPYFDDNALGALNQFTPIGRQLLAGNVWNDTKLIGIRAALGNSQQSIVNSQPVNPAKIAIICDSEGEAALSFNQFISDVMARYPSTSPSLLHIQGGFNGGNVLYPWTGTGTFTDIDRGASGHLATLTTGQTLQTSPVIAGDVEYGDRIRIHYLPNVGTFHVTIDGVAAVGADGVNTGTTAVNTGANARDVVSILIGTQTTAGSEYQLTSFGLFTEDMVGSIVTCANLPAGTRVVSYSSTSVVHVDQQALATGTPTATFARPSWTSAKLEKGPHTVVVTGASGTVKIDGIFYYQGNYNTQGGVQVHLISHSGWTTADFLALSGIGAPTAHVAANVDDLQQYLTDEGFHLVIFETGINDNDLSAYKNAMQQLMAITSFAALPNADLLLWVPEPKAGHTGTTGMSAIATTMAEAIGAAVADMNTIAPNLVNQTGGHPDQPYALTTDGVHYSTTGARLVSDVLLGVIDGGVARGAQLYTPFVGETGILATPVSELVGTATGYAIFESISQTNPDLFMGKWGLGSGFMAGDPAATTFAPDTFWLRTGAGSWDTNGSAVTVGGVLTGSAPVVANAGMQVQDGFAGLTIVCSEQGTSADIPATLDLRGGRGDGSDFPALSILFDNVAQILFAGSKHNGASPKIGVASIKAIATETYTEDATARTTSADSHLTHGTTTYTSASASFSSSTDVGASLTGVSGLTGLWIASVQSSTSVTLSAAFTGTTTTTAAITITTHNIVTSGTQLQFLATSAGTTSNHGDFAMSLDPTAMNNAGQFNTASQALGTKTASYDIVTVANATTVTLSGSALTLNAQKIAPAVTLTGNTLNDINGTLYGGTVTVAFNQTAFGTLWSAVADNTTIRATTGAGGNMLSGAVSSVASNPTVLVQDNLQAHTLDTFINFAAGATLTPGGSTGTLAVTTLTQFNASLPAAQTNVTVGTMRGLNVANPGSSAGTITTLVGVDIAQLTRATTNIGFRNAGSTVYTPVTVTVTSNAGTVPVTCSLAKLTNSSAATITVTLATANAVDGQLTRLRIYDATGATQTITWVNTETGKAGAPPTPTFGSTTIPTTATFAFNGTTSKWTYLGN